METINTTYIADLRTRAIHLLSGNELITDAPIDNMGKGEAFPPTDLVATALSSCMLTLMGIAAKRYDFIGGTKVRTTKVMASEPRRIGEIVLEFDFPSNNFTEKERKIIERATLTCPVAKSLHPDLNQSIKFNF